MSKEQKRTDKTLERERELNKNPNPNTRKRKEKIFGKGYGELDKLAKGVVLEDDCEDIADPDQEEMTPEEEAMFKRWAKLAAKDVDTETQIVERALRHKSRLLTERKKKKKDKDCIGNKYHRGGTEFGETSKAGQFSSKEDAGSSSIRKKNNTNCSPHTTRMPGNKWISKVKDCGRAGSKQYKCSTDQLKEQELGDDQVKWVRDWFENFVEESLESYFDQHYNGSIEEKKKSPLRPLKDYTREEITQICGRYNLMSLDQFLGLIDRIERAKSGKITEPRPPK